jgi:hypothetical protein
MVKNLCSWNLEAYIDFYKLTLSKLRTSMQGYVNFQGSNSTFLIWISLNSCAYDKKGPILWSVTRCASHLHTPAYFLPSHAFSRDVALESYMDSSFSFNYLKKNYTFKL